MRRLAHALVRLYPAEWRVRYGEEFRALLDECPPEKLRIGEILRGALAMRIRSWMRSPIGAMGLFALAGASIMTLWAFSVAPRYVSHGWLNAANPASVAQAVQTATSRDALAALLDRHDLYPEARRSQPLEQVVDRLRKDISIKPVLRRQGGTAVEVAFTSPDPAKAQAVTRELLTTLIDSGEGMQVLDLPPVPRQPIWPNHLAAAIVGSLGGAAAGIAGYFVLRRSTPVSAS